MKADALVVLGAKVDDHGVPSGALSRRLGRAVQAYQDGLAPVILCSGGKHWPGGVEAVVMWRHLVACGVPRDDVFIEALSLNTLQNALFSSKMARIMGWRRLAVVSCAWHLPRARADFQRFGMDVAPVPARPHDHGAIGHSLTFVSERVSSVLDRVRYYAWISK